MLNALTNVRFRGQSGHDANRRQQGYRPIYRSKNGWILRPLGWRFRALIAA